MIRTPMTEVYFSTAHNIPTEYLHNTRSNMWGLNAGVHCYELN